MADTKDTQILQSSETEKFKSEIFDIVVDDKERRDQPFPFFRNETLSKYTDTARQLFIGHNEKPDWKEDYQYNVFDPIPRDKIMAIISKTSGYYEAQFFNANKRLSELSETISNVLGAFYKDACYRLKDKDKNRDIMLAALTTPKAIWYEGWRFKKRKIKEITERDDMGRITKTTPKNIVYSNDPYGELIPVEDFIAGSLRIRDLQEQPRLTWVSKMQEGQFKREFSEKMYPAVSQVKTFGALINTDDSMEYTPLRGDLKENEVEVIRYFNKWDDEYYAMANGVMLTDRGNPMPFDHKNYPFVWGGFEQLDPSFIYDMPMTIKLMDMTDANNEVLNLSLDMLWRALNEVVLVGAGDEINDDVLYSGGIVDVNNPQNFQKFSFGNASTFNASEQLLKRIKESMEQSSVDSTMAGQAGSGRQVTAREVLVAREAALEIASLFLENMESMERDKATLRVQNMLDRYQKPKEWTKRIGEKLFEKAQPIFRTFSVRNANLDMGKTGVMNINITNEPRPKQQVNQENDSIKELSQTIDISPDFIRDIEFEVEIIPNSSVKKSKQTDIADARQFMVDAAGLPQVFNIRNAAESYVKQLGKNPDDALIAESPAGAFNEMGANQPNKQIQRPGVGKLATELPL